MKVKIKHNGNVIAENILIASDPASQLVGLMFRESPPQNSNGLLLDPCRSIHTCFMKYDLDIIFLNKKNKVVKVIRNMKPWRMTWIYFTAKKTLELRGGKFPMTVKEGDILEIEHV